MVRLFDFLALRADRQARGFEVFMGASLVPAGFGVSVFWVRHGFVMLLFIFSVNLLTLKMHRNLPVHFADDRILPCSGPPHRRCKDLYSQNHGAVPWGWISATVL